MRTLRFLSLVLVASSAACGGASAGQTPTSTSSSVPTPPPPMARAIHPTRRDVPELWSADVTLAAGSASEVSARAAGTVAVLVHRVGDHVARNDVLARLTPDRGARAIELRAPIAGEVYEERAQLGQHVEAGAVLYVVGDAATIRVRAEVPEADAPRVRPGQPALLTTDAMPGRVYQTAIDRIAPALDPDRHALPIELVVQNEDRQLRPGSSAHLQISLAVHAQALVVPEDAVVERGAASIVLVPSDGVARAREVRTGAREGGEVEIVAGLEESDTVLVPAASLTDGGPFTAE